MRATDAAQLGIRPKMAAIIWLITGLLYIIAARFSLPIRKIARLITVHTERIKREITLIPELEEDSDINVSFETNEPTIEVIGPKTYIERISAVAVVIPKGEGYIGNTITTFSSVQFIDKNGMSIMGTTPYLSYDIRDIVVEIKNPEVAK